MVFVRRGELLLLEITQAKEAAYTHPIKEHVQCPQRLAAQTLTQ